MTAAVLLAACAEEPDASGGYAPYIGAGLIWPISGSSSADSLSSTFGPRIKASSGNYDFHRGIDIPADRGTPVYAVAAGEVMIAGRDSDFPDPVVQLLHCSDRSPPADLSLCENPYYTNYQHLSRASVDPGEWVRQGQIIGQSGVASSSGYAHLHFEVRRGSSWQRAAVHPLELLPHTDSGTPVVTGPSFDFSDLAAPIIQMDVSLPASELDLLRVEAALVNEVSGEVLVEQSYDMNEWNLKYTVDDDPNVKLDNPYFHGITVRPEPFSVTSEAYVVRFRFRRLITDVSLDLLRVRLRATDVSGRTVELECHPDGCP